jgi:hypothetical protein
MKRFAVVLVLLAASVSAALAADSPFAGTWKQDVGKSKLAGSTFTYTATAAGFQYSNGSTVKFDFATDGRDYPAMPGRTVSWIKSGDNSWDSVWKDDHGTVISKVHRVLSPDGKTMTDSHTDFRANGTTSEGTDISERVSGGPGLAGTWKEVKVSPAADTVIISVPSKGHIRYEFPKDKTFVEGPVDGTPSRYQGPRVADCTIAFKQKTPNELEWAFAVKGTVMFQGVDTVSSDGRSLNSVNWAPGKESEKTTQVYDKQ